MRNILKNLFEQIRHNLSLFALMLFVKTLAAQPMITENILNSCDVEINTVLTTQLGDPPSIPVGLFYRLERSISNSTSTTKDSYFWEDETVAGTLATQPKMLTNLPNGQYNLISYELRKNGPIRTGGKSWAISNNNCNNNIMPKVGMSASSPSSIMLKPSWNAFANTSFDHTPCDQLTANGTAVMSPAVSWLFVTVTIYKWSSQTYNGNNLEKVDVLFDDSKLAYAGAIESNHQGKWSNNNWEYIDNIIMTGPNLLTIARKPTFQEPDNLQTHVYLIFQKLDNSTDNLDFNASFQGANVNAPDFYTDISVPVKGNPHDPNSLEVDKNQLCPCQVDETLTYQVNFQNKGTAPAAKVEIELISNSNHLDISSIAIVPNNQSGLDETSWKKAKITKVGSNKFSIEKGPSIQEWLPGSAQTMPKSYPYAETEDYFKFTIKKKDCLKLSTVIQPHVRITFTGATKNNLGTITGYDTPQNYIETNLEKTEILNFITKTDTNCPAPNPVCKNCTKKTCWLFRWLKREK